MCKPGGFLIKERKRNLWGFGVLGLEFGEAVEFRGDSAADNFAFKRVFQQFSGTCMGVLFLGSL